MIPKGLERRASVKVDEEAGVAEADEDAVFAVDVAIFAEEAALLVLLLLASDGDDDGDDDEFLEKLGMGSESTIVSIH